MEPLTITDLGEFWSLQLECGFGPPIEDIVERHDGRIANGYFFASVAEFLCQQRAPALREQVVFDPEGNAFFANAPTPEHLHELGTMMADVINDPEALEQLFTEADAANFTFEG